MVAMAYQFAISFTNPSAPMHTKQCSPSSRIKKHQWPQSTWWLIAMYQHSIHFVKFMVRLLYLFATKPYIRIYICATVCICCCSPCLCVCVCVLCSVCICVNMCNFLYICARAFVRMSVQVRLGKYVHSRIVYECVRVRERPCLSAWSSPRAMTLVGSTCACVYVCVSVCVYTFTRAYDSEHT